MTAVYLGALEAVDPYRLVAREDLSQAPPFLLALGKAALPMSRAALDQRAFEEALVVAPSPGPEEDLPGYRLVRGRHPVPDASSLRAGELILEFARRARQGMLVLLSGGGSSLAEVPGGALTLEELRQVTRALLGAGVPIERINAVRRHLSRLKGGRLARLARCQTLALSDVIGSPPEAIASGPTVPDPSRLEEAVAICRSIGLPTRVLAALEETPKPGEACFVGCSFRVLADNRTLAEAASRLLGGRLLSRSLEGEARELAVRLAALGPGRWVASGEPTVTLGGEPGKGGRCQELALAFALLVEGQSVRLLAAGSDGIDGPTDAAGAVVDGSTCPRARALGLDPEAHLRAHDAYPLLEAVGALIRTGPTGTNANDLFLLERD